MKKRRKKYRVNSRRLTISITLISLFILLAFSTIFSLAGERTAPEPDCLEVVVHSGDTLWEIARTYSPQGVDIRKTVYRICQINDISPEDLRPGQMVRVPV